MSFRYNLPVGDIVGMYVSGQSENAVAKHFGMGRGVIRRRLREAGIHVRTQSEAETLKWSMMTTAQRMAQVSAANHAARGSRRDISVQAKIAQTRQRRQTHVGPDERIVRRFLETAGIECIPQQAVGPYNCDLGCFPVAVEVFSSHWLWGNSYEKRFRYLLNADWCIYVLPVSRSSPITESRMRHLIAYIEQARRDPPTPREYRVVWSAGEWERVGYLDDDKIVLDPPFTGRRNATTGQYERVAR